MTMLPLAILLAFPQPPEGDQPPSRFTVSLKQCASLPEGPARLTCYDREVVALLTAVTTQDVVLVDRADVRSAHRKSFGFDRSPARSTGKSANDLQDKSDFIRLDTKITSGKSAGYGRWRFTVSEGSIWETLETNSGFDEPRPGASVTIERNTLGGYFAQIGRGRAVRTRRIG
ncbi:hypothetical protein [Sphingomonas sp. CARO-RG-8B-R24-01]|uniref:hypothetical protein n=1 Tax=Sphingomonas sp. CARO-RG-8B-R24-01 TaxID=2914831 RepID=UPI001F586F65|nr:hypothetical protein [Sphingomonas sp. CARO-RG-8B-R24-01]